jgi:hypothetical protein
MNHLQYAVRPLAFLIALLVMRIYEMKRLVNPNPVISRTIHFSAIESLRRTSAKKAESIHCQLSSMHASPLPAATLVPPNELDLNSAFKWVTRKHVIERAVILGTAKRQHLVAGALRSPGSRPFETHMTNERVGRFDPAVAQMSNAVKTLLKRQIKL